ncbi:hypothetical protein [Acidithiobacillus thiooxidans]|uniref:Uncharacterized protein n=1 Tax=Acidithiobacillus thiooxidans TaxID=930 RepID=A0A1C2IPJ0_ACITH|nr:hypothetical protein [Acidithiobacillus thiooxidans]OCX69886.1 hypothetical protein A6M23_14695 [Acidithiobacillus thiooxidans]OCX77912.1 hypothetical protein A6P08_20540 [Acidithiobacillus thiooxidans]
MESQFNAGDVVKVPFPTDDGRTLPHYGVVKLVESTFGGELVTVVYGSSKKVSPTGHLPHEFVLFEEEDLRLAGLKVPTRFDFKVSAKFRPEECALTGKLRLDDPKIANGLRRAIQAVYNF